MIFQVFLYLFVVFHFVLLQIYLAYLSDTDNVSMYALRREYAGSGIIYIHGGSGSKAVTDII